MIDRRTLLFALPLLGFGTANAAAQPYRARLIAAERDGVTWTAGVDIVLDKGWKTYWRMPGEAGIPPSFDWKGSQHVKTIEVLWPAPRRFDGASGLAIDPHGNVLVVEQSGRIRRIAPDGVVTTLAGSGRKGSKDGSLLEATFDEPTGIALAPNGDWFVLEPHRSRVRKISDGRVTTIHPGLR